MSLKAVHIAFILLSVLLSAGFAVWAFQSYAEGGSAGMLVVALTSVLFGVGLTLYGVRFLRKLKHVSFL